MLNHHHAGLGHITAHFHQPCGTSSIGGAAAKAVDRRLLVRGLSMRPASRPTRQGRRATSPLAGCEPPPLSAGPGVSDSFHQGQTTLSPGRPQATCWRISCRPAAVDFPRKQLGTHPGGATGGSSSMTHLQDRPWAGNGKKKGAPPPPQGAVRESGWPSIVSRWAGVRLAKQAVALAHARSGAGSSTTTCTGQAGRTAPGPSSKAWVPTSSFKLTVARFLQQFLAARPPVWSPVSRAVLMCIWGKAIFAAACGRALLGRPRWEAIRALANPPRWR